MQPGADSSPDHDITLQQGSLSLHSKIFAATWSYESESLGLLASMGAELGR